MPKNPNTIAVALKYLNQKNNEVIVSQFKEGIDKTLSKITGELVAEVESAVVLNETEKLKMEKDLAAIFGKSLTVSYQINHTLLGGFKITVGDWKFDATLVQQLDAMRIQLGGHHG